MADPAPTSPHPPERGVVTALAAWTLSPRWAHRLSLLAILAGVALGAALLISPGLNGPQLPLLDESDLRRPFQASSPAGLKASRDYEVIDQEETRRRRADARAAVRPVYDLNPAVPGEVRTAVGEAFAHMRTRLEGLAAAREAARAEATPAPGRRRTAAEPTPSLPSEVEVLREERGAFERRLLGSGELHLDDDDFEALVAGRFSQELQDAVLLLVTRGYESPLASTREELGRDAPQGLTVRNVRDRTEAPLSSHAPAVLSLREAQEALDRFASVPGNLLPERPALQRRAVLRLAKRLLRPNLTVNIDETALRRRQAEGAVKDALITIKKGQRVIGDGELINETHLVVLAGMRAQTRQLDGMQLQVGSAGLTAALVGCAFLFCVTTFRRFRLTRKDAAFLGAMLLVMLGLIQAWISVADAVRERSGSLPLEALYFAIPVAAGAMVVRFVLNAYAALFFAVVLSSLCGVMLGHSVAFGVYTLAGSLVGTSLIARARDRAGIFRAGVATGVANGLLVVFLQLAEGKGFMGDTLSSALVAAVGTTLAVPVLVMAMTPLAEMGFGYASDIKLLELANLNHPALKELIVQAPGTYHHSIIIGTLVENAAEAIDANPLLARTCAYYHDIGKGKNPLYFGENQKGENRHDPLAPAMSAVIIKRHVTDGIEMARHYRLPKLVVDAIPQHHGTRLVGYFYHKALKEAEGRPDAPPVDEVVFRYPGPKPQFREAALVMIADAVEASCRALPEPTTERLRAQVQKMINGIFSEGQLDECDLTLKDLNLIAQSFLRTLEGIYHSRPEYPPGAVKQDRSEPVKVQALAGGKTGEKRSATSS